MVESVQPGVKLKPCPFCGGDLVELYESQTFPTKFKHVTELMQQTKRLFFVKCGVCQSEIYLKAETEEHAKMIWNMRAKQ